MTVGELKAHVSEVLDQLAKNGEPVVISYGKKRKKLPRLFLTANSSLKQNAIWV